VAFDWGYGGETRTMVVVCYVRHVPWRGSFFTHLRFATHCVVDSEYKLLMIIIQIIIKIDVCVPIM
jgi:hypothetical protein